MPFKKCEFKGSAEKHLKIKETDKIYSDASLYGVASPPSARPSLPRRLRENLRLQLGEDEEDSTDDNYETVTSTQVYCRSVFVFVFVPFEFTTTVQLIQVSVFLYLYLYLSFTYPTTG